MILYLFVNKLIVLIITHCIFIFTHSCDLYFRLLQMVQLFILPPSKIACWIRPWPSLLLRDTTDNYLSTVLYLKLCSENQWRIIHNATLCCSTCLLYTSEILTRNKIYKLFLNCFFIFRTIKIISTIIDVIII